MKLLSNKNFIENAKCLKRRYVYSEMSFSEFQRNVEYLLKRYNKLECEFIKIKI